jgi:hypothetical protein
MLVYPKFPRFGVFFSRQLWNHSRYPEFYKNKKVKRRGVEYIDYMV